MTREQIEKAALLCAGAGEYGECPYNPDAKKGFIAGAEWRINSVWHDAKNAVPDRFRLVLVEKDDEGFTLNIANGKMSSCPMFWKSWAYISDLLPERKEETK